MMVDAVLTSPVGSVPPVGAVPVGTAVAPDSPVLDVELTVPSVPSEYTGAQPSRLSHHPIIDIAAI